MNNFLDGLSPSFQQKSMFVLVKKHPLPWSRVFHGEIAEVGSDVTCVKVGDRVTIELIWQNINPNRWLQIWSKLELCCLKRWYYGSIGVLMVICMWFPDSLSYEQVFYRTCKCCCLCCLSSTALKTGGQPLFFGLGPLVLDCWSPSKRESIKIYEVELSPERQAKSKKS